MDSNKYDWIVVGGGISGITIAEILCRDGKSVLLLEKNKQLSSETSKVFHEWMHSGSLYSLAPDKLLTLRYLLGATDDLFEYYNSQKTQIEFKPDIPSPKNTNDILWKILKLFKKYLVPFRYYLPSKFDTSFERKLIMKRIRSAISALNDEESISLVWSGYEPIPGPFLPGLEETSELLKTYSLNVFN